MSKTDETRIEDGLSRREFLQSGTAATLATVLGSSASAQSAHEESHAKANGNKAGKVIGHDADFPRVWLTSAETEIPSSSFADIASHGVQVIETTDIESARKHGLYAMLASDVGGMFMGEVIEGKDATRNGFTPEYAVAIAGTYQGLSIDSHTFPFNSAKYTVEIGLPFHYAPYDWKAKKYFTDNHTFDSYFDSHIFSTDQAFKAEVVIKQKDYDGKQHLTIIPASIGDRGTESLHITFNLTGVNGDLDQTMLAVYWRTNQLSPSAASTRDCMVEAVRTLLERFAKENGGSFPGDVIHAMRFGDECFLRTGFANSPKCALPVYDYSDSGIAGYRKLNASDDYPRAWGFPEFFGVNAYRDWLYAFHTATAELVKSVVSEAHKIAPRLLVFRNPTRFNPTPFATLANDHDGCSAQLLTEQFDMLNPDPYPVWRTGDSQCTNADRDPRAGYISAMIPLENAYWSGLVRRFGKKLVPWMQAHTFSFDLQHPSPNDVQRMYQQVEPYNPDGIMWLGYEPGDREESPRFGMTLPNLRPETWKALRCIHERARHDLGRPKKVPEVAVLRFYGERSLVDLERRHLHDRFLTEQILTGLTIDLDIPYDIFEYYKREDVDCRELRNYRHVILCVTDLEGLPLDEFERQGIALSIVCWNAESLAAHSGFSGVTKLVQLPGEAIGVTAPVYKGALVPENYTGITEWKSDIEVQGPLGVAIPAGLAWGATLRPAATAIAKVGDACCVWRHKNVTFSSFLPKDPFDDGEYVRWLLIKDNLT